MQCAYCGSVKFRKKIGTDVWICSACKTAEGECSPPSWAGLGPTPDVFTGKKLTFSDCVAAESAKIEDKCKIPRGEFGGRDLALDGRRLV